MDSMFIASMVPLLPVSMAEMPSIIRLFCDWPPSRTKSVEPPDDDAGGELNQAREVLPVDRQVLDLFARHREGALRALRLHEQRFGADVDRLGDATGLEDHGGTPMRSPPLTRTLVRRAVLNESIVISMV